MKLLIIGCGSIGQRHIKNLLALKAGEIFAFDVDPKHLEKVKEISPEISCSILLDDLWIKQPDVAFITTPTSLHIQYAVKAARRGCHLFIEKPLAHDFKGVGVLERIVKKENLITLVACNMRFYWAICKIKNLLDKKTVGKVISARVETGQYLPDWRPKQDYRKAYSAIKELGGGVILDGIHEIDYLRWFFGDIDKFTSIYGRFSDLEIETEDVLEAVVKFKNGPLVSVHMDYVQRGYGRGCKIIGDKGTIIWDINEHKVKIYLAGTRKWRIIPEPADFQLNQMYIDEIKYFLKCVRQKQPTFNDVGYAGKTLHSTLAIKKNGIALM